MWARVAHASVRLPLLAVVLAALWSFARLPHIPWTFSLPIALIALLTALKPLEGLLTVAAFVPIATVTARLAGTLPFRTPEVVALAGIAGWLARTTFDRSWPVPARVRVPAACFALVVTASAIVELSVLQVQRDYPGAFLQSFLRWLALDYVSDYRSFTSIHAAALLLEGIALFGAAAAACARTPVRAAPLRRMLVIGASAAALVTVLRLAAAALASESPLYAVRTTLIWVRFNAHFGDVNAAGSQFALVLIIACGLFAADRRRRPLWMVCAALIAAGLWTAGSRTAHAGFLSALACWALVSFAAPRWPRAVRPTIILPLVGAIVLVTVAAVGVTARTNGDVRRAIEIRLDLTRMAWQMTRSAPLFGIGVGRFYPESGPLLTPRLREYYNNENAHNNFLQIVAELGVIGGIAFVWLLWSVLGAAMRTWRDRSLEQNVTLFAVAGFLLTALGGHPLLIPEVAVTFWLALAAVAAELPPAVVMAASVGRRRVAAVAIAALAGSVVVRARADRAATDLDHVTYGFDGWRRGAEGERFRTARDEATLFVLTGALNTFRVEIPLRADGRPVGFRIDVDGQRAVAFQLAPGVWRNVVLTIPASPRPLKRVTIQADGAFMSGPVRKIRIGPLWRWGDADGDGRADLTVFRPSTAEWLTATSSSDFSRTARFVLGAAGLRPVPRDYDGDGIQDAATHDSANATWRVGSSRGHTEQVTQFGMAGDVAVPADYDGDDKSDLAVFRPASGLWAVKQSSNGEVFTMLWGKGTDIPVPADYDGDGRANLAIFRPDTGEWWILDPARRSSMSHIWGKAGDVPVPADYDGDFSADVAIYRPSVGTWHVRASTEGISSTELGLPGDVPMPADYDGDGKSELAVFRPSINRWSIHRGAERTWGQAADLPVPRLPGL